MNMVRSFLLSVLVMSCGSAMATEFFLLNKTPKPLYYKVGYHNVGQDLLSIPAAGAQDRKVMQWFEQQLEPKTGEGMLAPNAVAHVKSYRLIYLVLSETKQEGRHGQIVSFAGDKRVMNACQTRKQNDCVGTTLKDIHPSIVQGFDVATMSGISLGYIKFQQKGLTALAVPLVLVATQDPILEAQGKVGYIVTELAHTWGVVRTPKSFFYELQGMTLPGN